MNNSGLYKVQERFLFHSRIRIKLPVHCDSRLIDELFHIMEEVNRKYNSYSEGSTFDRINQNAGKFTLVDGETIEILEKVKSYSDFFNGLYDITVMPLLRLWGFYKDEVKRLPGIEEIKNILRLVDYRKIKVDNLHVRIEKGQEIITGSFIKAYAVDKVIERLKAENITDAVINAGGSSIAVRNNEFHPYWKINVSNPVNDTLKLFTLKLSNACYSTSSQGKSFVEVGGKRYGHILNPKTGYSSGNMQVGIITPGCFTGDILSTALFNIPTADFLNVINKLSQHIPVAAFLMNEHGEVIQTGNFDSYKDN